MIWPIFVPTKGRSATSQFLKNFASSDVTMVVEPSEERAYCAAYPKCSVTVLPRDNYGLHNTRQWVLEVARRLGHTWYWMIDDDVGRFVRVEDRKLKACRIDEALLAAQGMMRLDDRIQQVALEYQQFAWSAKPQSPVSWDSYCDVVVGIHTGVKANYRKTFKEDRDFTLQVIASGARSCRYRLHGFACPPNGSNKGGLYDAYKAGEEARGAAHLAELWPWCVTVQKKPNGRTDAKINWKAVRRHAA